MIKKIEKISFPVILLLAMVLTAMGFAAKGCIEYRADLSARKNGSLVTKQLTVADFTTDGMREKDGQWQTTDGDSQMIYSPDGMFTGLAFTADYLVYPGDIILYYTTQPGADYSAKNRLYVSQDTDNPQLFSCSMPATYVADIRLDPTTLAGNLIDFDTITINPPLTSADYLAVTPYTVLMFGIYSLLLAAILRFVQEFFTKKFE